MRSAPGFRESGRVAARILPLDDERQPAGKRQAVAPVAFRNDGNDDVKSAAAGRLCIAFEAQRPQRLAHQLARLDHLRPGHVRTGIEVENDPIWLLDAIDARVPGVDLDRVHLYERDQRWERIRDQILAELRLLLDADAAQRLRGPHLRMPHERAVVSDGAGTAEQRQRPSREMRDDVFRDGLVIAGEVQLGEADVREDDPPGVTERNACDSHAQPFSRLMIRDRGHASRWRCRRSRGNREQRQPAGINRSIPPRYGRIAAGSTTEPSACCPFSRMATTVRPTASPLPFNVCAKRGFSCGPGRKRICARRAWKSENVEHELISRYASCPGNHTSRSYVFSAEKPRSPVQSATTRWWSPSLRSGSCASSTSCSRASSALSGFSNRTSSTL